MRDPLLSVKKMLSLEEFVVMNIVTPRYIYMMIKNNKPREGFKLVEKNKRENNSLKKRLKV